MTKRDRFYPADYWEKRLSNRIDLRGTGHRAFDLEYNRWLYIAQSDSLNLLLDRNQISLDDKSVVDIGSGNGYYIDFMIKHGVNQIVGLDITQSSVDYLQETFPECAAFKADISDLYLPISDKFDLLTAISVLFHITDDEKFSQSIQNIATLTKPGGYAILSDTFTKPIINPVSHVRFRSISTYEHELTRAGFKILDLVPMFYLLNRTFVPMVGPKIICLTKAGRTFYNIDTLLRNRGMNNWNGSKLLLIQKKN